MTHVMPVGRGAFILRYVATAETKPPRVIVAKDPDATAGIDLLFSPGAAGGVLRQPGDLCVISSVAEGRILVTTLGRDLTRPEAVTLKLERIDQDAQPAQPSRPALTGDRKPTPSHDLDVMPVPLRVVGHVELDGDVTVASGEWLGGDDRHIEGFALQWPRRPANVDISYGCSVKGMGRLPDAVVGEFVGTRQQARSLNGVSFGLIGEDAKSYSLWVEAEFSDGTRLGPQEAPVDFRGPTGREKLVGLSLTLTKLKAPADVGRRSPPARSNGAKAPAAATSRQVRVFRAPKQPNHLNQR